MASKRKRKIGEYKSFKLSKRIKPPVQKKLSSVRLLLFETWKHMRRYKRTYFGMMLVYIVLLLLLVKGLTSTFDIIQTRQDYREILGLSGLSLNLALFGDVATTSASGLGELASTYQTILTIIFVLAFIWLFRQTSESPKTTIKIRRPFYEGMQPLIPFVLVLVVISLQLVPFIAGLGLYATVQNNGLAATTAESFVWGLLAVMLALLSLYMLSSSLFALIIVTLPEMTPIKALQSARKVVRFRRWLLMRKIAGILIVLVLLSGIITISVIMTVPVLAEWVWLILGAITLPLAIGSMYRLYRELL